DPDDLVAGRLQCVEGVGEVARLLGAPGRHRRGVEVDDHATAGEVRQRDLLAGVGGQREGGGGVAGGEAVAHGSSSGVDRAWLEGGRLEKWSAREVVGSGRVVDADVTQAAPGV